MGSSKHIEKSRDYDYLHPWLGTGLLTSSGKNNFKFNHGVKHDLPW